MTVPLMVYGTDRVYTQIAHRLRTKYRIQLAEHIDSMNVLHSNVQDGFWFTPKDHKRLVDELLATRAFQHDDRRELFHAVAASATQGEGYREISDTSIHCQVSKSTVNMHIDYTGFVWRGPNGEVLIGPDAPFHILDELKWPELIKWVSSKNKTAGKIVARIHPTIPRSENRYLPQVGAQFDIHRGRSFDLSKQWALTLDFRWGCTDYTCRRTVSYTGLNFTLKVK
jgi:hypothetical protein